MSDLNRAEIARSQLMYDASRKSVGVAYLLLIFLGGFGAHRFYLGRTGSAFGMLLLNFVGWLTLLAGVGLVLLGFAWLWLFVDLFLVPGIARRHNMRLANELTGGYPAMI
ncbi:TM2 domain-containing protein [Sphingomonas sp. Marseille-Q8236]|jgi:TM2 domain-containing membrane protein YozV